jgi:hypothetical protein
MADRQTILVVADAEGDGLPLLRALKDGLIA